MVISEGNMVLTKWPSIINCPLPSALPWPNLVSLLSFLQASELCLSSNLSKHKQKRGMCLPPQFFLGISLPQRDTFPISPHWSFSLLCLAFPPKILFISLCLSLLYSIKEVFFFLFDFETLAYFWDQTIFPIAIVPLQLFVQSFSLPCNNHFE